LNKKFSGFKTQLKANLNIIKRSKVNIKSKALFFKNCSKGSAIAIFLEKIKADNNAAPLSDAEEEFPEPAKRFALVRIFIHNEIIKLPCNLGKFKKFKVPSEIKNLKNATNINSIQKRIGT
jgi:hypothetical protein